MPVYSIVGNLVAFVNANNELTLGDLPTIEAVHPTFHLRPLDPVLPHTEFNACCIGLMGILKTKGAS